MKKEAEQKKLQAERVDRRLVGYNYFLFIIYIFLWLKPRRTWKQLKQCFFFLYEDNKIIYFYKYF